MIMVKRKPNSHHVLDALNELFLRRGIPEHIRLDNGSEYTAKAVSG